MPQCVEARPALTHAHLLAEATVRLADVVRASSIRSRHKLTEEVFALASKPTRYDVLCGFVKGDEPGCSFSLPFAFRRKPDRIPTEGGQCSDDCGQLRRAG
jgi:hypothetical protein